MPWNFALTMKRFVVFFGGRRPKSIPSWSIVDFDRYVEFTEEMLAKLRTAANIRFLFFRVTVL